jgi:predicted DNA-binding protein
MLDSWLDRRTYALFEKITRNFKKFQNFVDTSNNVEQMSSAMSKKTKFKNIGVIIPVELEAKLKRIAKSQGRSLSTHARFILAENVEHWELASNTERRAEHATR